MLRRNRWFLVGTAFLATVGCGSNEVLIKKQTEFEARLDQLVQANAATNARLGEVINDLKEQQKRQGARDRADEGKRPPVVRPGEAFADGTVGSSTALLHAPYADDATTSGLECLTIGEMQERIELAYRHGGDVAVHAIGDLATTNVLNAIEGARKKFPGTRRDRIEHVQLMHPTDFARFRSMDVVASCQPVHLHTDMLVAEKKWGIERCQYGYAWKSMLKEGIRVQFGSDAKPPGDRPGNPARARRGPPAEPSR